MAKGYHIDYIAWDRDLAVRIASTKYEFCQDPLSIVFVSQRQFLPAKKTVHATLTYLIENLEPLSNNVASKRFLKISKQILHIIVFRLWI